jgi:hypothetical protein
LAVREAEIAPGISAPFCVECWQEIDHRAQYNRVGFGLMARQMGVQVPASVPAAPSDAEVHRLLRRLLEVALWAQECTPDTLYEHFGDLSSEIAQAEALLKARPADA